MKNRKNQSEGMSLPELVLAIFMLVAFTGFTVTIVRYTSRFFQPLNEEAKEEYITSEKELQDLLNDHTKINNAFDSIIEILSEPGIKKDFILNLNQDDNPFKISKLIDINYGIRNFIGNANKFAKNKIYISIKSDNENSEISIHKIHQ